VPSLSVGQAVLGDEFRDARCLRVSGSPASSPRGPRSPPAPAVAEQVVDKASDSVEQSHVFHLRSAEPNGKTV